VKSLSDKAFINLWQIIYRATNSSPEIDRWRVDEVDWRRQRHRYSGESYSFSIETHWLTCSRNRKSGWVLLVVVEHWWDGEHEPLRTTVWTRTLAGSRRAIIDWFREQGRIRGVSTGG
jgi:hypothetical protein